MKQTEAIRERDFLDNLIPALEAEGFTIFLHPSREILPAFMGNYRPDAIAVRPDKKIAIEVKTNLSSSRQEIAKIQQEVSRHPEWELRVYYSPPPTQEEPLATASLSSIEDALVEADKVRQAGHMRAALIASWAILEAAARALLPEELARPQRSEKLVDVLGGEGALTPTEVDRLRCALKARNAAAHGQLDAVVNPSDVDAVIGSAQILARLIAGKQSRDANAETC